MRYYEHLLRRCRSGDLRRAEVRGDWPKFRPALVLTFNGEEQVAIRHTNWLPFLREVYVAQLMDKDKLNWALELAHRSRK